MPGGRAGTPGASYEKTRREQSSQEDREARLDRQRLRSNHLTPRQRWVPRLVIYMNRNLLDGSVLQDTQVAMLLGQWTAEFKPEIDIFI